MIKKIKPYLPRLAVFLILGTVLSAFSAQLLSLLLKPHNTIHDTNLNQLTHTSIPELINSSFKIYLLTYILYNLLIPKQKLKNILQKSLAFIALYYLLWSIFLWI